MATKNTWEKRAELYFLPGGILPQTLDLAAEDRGLSLEHHRTGPVAVVTWTAYQTPQPGFVGCGEGWPILMATASEDGVFDAEQILRRVALSGFYPNKEAAIAILNTWFWIGIVGMNGVLRKRFLIRHTLPDQSPARWELWWNQKDGRWQLRRPKGVS